MFRQTISRFRSRAARVMRPRISRGCTPSEGFALQRTDNNLYSDRQDLVSVRVQPVLCARAYHGGARPRRDSPYSERTANLSSDRQYRVSVRVQPVLCVRAYHGGARPRRDSPYSERTAIYIQIDKISFPFACSPCYASSISRRCTPSEGFALQRTDSNTKFDRQNLVSVRVQPVLCFQHITEVHALGGIRLTANGQ